MRKKHFSVLLFSLLLALVSTVNAAPEKLVLHLGWKHQFQFAGYYAALHKGFYADAKLDVALIEGGNGKFSRPAVINGRAQYGVSGVGLLLNRFHGAPVVVLAAVFQHSASILLSRSDSLILYPQDLPGKKIMLLPGTRDTDILSVLRSESIPLDSIHRLDHTYNLNDLIEGRIDAVSAYITNEPWLLRQKGVAPAILSPSSYGIDFYGECLFTTENEIEDHPDRMKRFLKASMKGWEYAMANKEEIIQLIIAEYKVEKEVAHLRYEAQTMEKLIFPKLVEMGHMNPDRWQHIAKQFKILGILPDSFTLDGFLYDPHQKDTSRLRYALISALVGLAIVSGLLMVFFRLHQKLKKESKQRQLSESRYQDLFNHISDGVAVYEAVDNGKDFVFRDLNRAGSKIDGVDLKDIIGKKVTDIFPGIAEYGLLQIFRDVWTTGNPMIHPVSFYQDNQLEGWRESHVYKLSTGEIVSAFEDLSEKMQAELEKKIIEQKLQSSQKMEAIGLMAGGVAHDLNNILSSITGYPDLMLMELDADSKLAKFARAIKESGQRAGDIVNDLLTVAKGVASEKQVANLDLLVRLFLTSPAFKKIADAHEQVSFKTSLDDDLKNITCSKAHMNKILINLTLNAAESIRETEGSVTISVRNQMVGASDTSIAGVEAGEYVVLSVQDTGAEISPADLEHMFDPFYAKKTLGRSGTGLGLTVVWNGVQEHGGGVKVKSSAEGTRFELYFPISQQALVKEASPQPEVVKPGHGEKILVVDDEPSQRDIVVRMLQSLNYDASAVASGEAAVEATRSDPVDLLVLDMIMAPGINGRETYRRIIDMYPNQKAIIASGFASDSEVKAALKLGVHQFIRKPYTLKDLSKAVYSALTAIPHSEQKP